MDIVNSCKAASFSTPLLPVFELSEEVSVVVFVVFVGCNTGIGRGFKLGSTQVVLACSEKSTSGV